MVAAFESVELLENRLLLAATKLAFTTTPTTGTAGQALGTVKVSVENSSGVVQTGDTSTVTIAVASGPGGLTAGSTTSVAAVNGVATFSNLVLDTAGTYKLKATDGSLTSATSGNITVSPAAASQLVLQQSPTTGTAGQALSPAAKVAVEDAFGNVVTSNTSTVTIAVATGPGGLTAGSTSSVAAVTGVATFSNLVLDTSGTYTLKATDGSLTSATSSNVTVNAAAASQLVLQQSPTTGTAGQALSPVAKVAVEDSFGNVVTSNTSTVKIAVAGGPGGLTAGSTTSVAAVSGVATFSNLVLDTAGTYTLKATDGSLTSATTGNITVSPAAASQLAFQATSTTGTAGQALSPSVQAAVEDAFGNVVTSNTSTVTIAVASGPGGLTAGSTTSVAAVSGVAIFSNLVLDTAGTYTLKATDGSLTSANSSNIVVSAAAASQLALAQSPTTGTAGQALSPATKVTVEDAFGNVVTSNTSTVTIAVASGPGGLTAGSTTSLAAVSGVATFSNLILDTAGTYTLSASDGAFTGVTTGNITVSPAAASQLVLQQSPTTGTAGQALSPSMQAAVEDAFGNVVTSNTSTVKIAVASGPGGLTAGSTTSVAAVSGVATFSNLVLDTAGTYTLKATDGALTSATTGNITVSPAAASQLAFQATATTGTAGQALSPSVQVAVKDAFGNVVTSNTSTVTIAVASGPGGMSAGSTTSVAAVNGVAIFSNLVLDAAGTYTLKATDGSLTSATSSNITVSAAAASQLVLQQSPTTGTAGQALSPAAKVAVEDAYGNVVTSNTSTVTIAVATGPGGLTAGSTTSVAAVSGVATFSNLVLDTAGTYTLSASDGALTGVTTGNITVSPAVASQLVVQQSPTTGTAGQALSPAAKVAVEDAFGNVVTSNTSTVKIAVASGPGGLTAGSTTSVAAVSGLATFSNLVLDTAGTYTLKATDGSLTSATTGNVTVSAAAGNHLTLLQSPTTGTAGQALSPSVQLAVEDAFGNVVISDTSTVTIAVASGPGGFAAGSTSSVAAVGGVASFSNLVLDTSGAYTLKATDGSLTSATSGNITVSPAVASQLVLQQSPTTGTAGQALSPAAKIAVEDAFGNVVTSNTSTVTIAVATGPGGLTAGSTTSVAAVSGVATFSNLVLDTSGTDTLSGTDGALTGATTGNITVSPAAASQLVFQLTSTTGTAGQTLVPSVQVAVEDAFGNVVTSNTSTAKIAVASGPGGLTGGSTTSVAAVSGVATFSNLIPDTAGTYTLKATDGSLTSATSANITVSPAAASQLVLQQSPTIGTAGQALNSSLQLAAEDAFGNVVTSDTSTVTIAIASGPGGLTEGSTASVSVVNGVATFSNLVLDTAGTYTLNATDGSLTGATSGNITVSPAAASQLAIQQSPTTGTAGQTLSAVTLAVEDAFGNVVTSDTSTVTLAITSGPGGLTAGSTTSMAAVNGVAAFSNLVLDTSGTYTLSASDGALTGATTNNVAISPATAGQLVLLQSPTSGTAGQTLGSVTLAVEDAFGNVVTSDASTVTIVATSGSGGLTAGSTTSVSVLDGVATFSNLLLDTAGTYTLSASDGALTGATTGSIAINPAAASQLVLLQSPTTGTAGQTLGSLTLAVEDTFGNLVTSDASTVTIALTSGPGALTASSTTSASVANGVATFGNLVLDTAGTYTLSLSDGGLTGATAGSIAVSPAAASQLVLFQSPTTGTAGQTLGAVRLAVEDAFGNVVTSDASTVTIAVTSGPGALTASSTTSASVANGVATFSNLVLDTSGTYTLSLSDGGLTGATTDSIAVSPAAASQLVLLQSPTTGTAGQMFGAVSLAVEDAFGNMETSDASTVTIAVTSGPGELTASSTTSVSVANGGVTFSNLILDTAGTYTLNATDGVLTGVTTGNIAISPAAASQLVLLQSPTTGTAGQMLGSVSLAVEDAFGNVVTSDASAVTITVTSGPGGLTTGSTTSAFVANGVATFSNLVLDTSGTYTLSASDGALTGAITGNIAISPAAASQLVLIQSPTTGTAGHTLGALALATEDAFGNLVTSDTSTITLAVGSGPGGLTTGSTTSVSVLNGVATFINLVLDTAGTYTFSASDDALTGATTGNIAVSPAAASQLVLIQSPTTGTAGQTLGAVSLAVEDAFGNVVTNGASTVTIAVTSGPGGLTAGSTTSAFVANGVATFGNLVLDTAGTYALNATDGSLTGAATGNIAVSPAAASQLVLLQSPTTGTAGQTLGAVSLAVEDAFGNLVTSDTSTVTLAVGSGPGGLTTGSATNSLVLDGVATFGNLVLDTSGTYTFSLSDGALTGATTGDIAVSPAAASQLVLLQSPTVGTAGQTLGAVTLAVEDAFGNVVTDDTSTATVAVASGPGGLNASSRSSVSVLDGLAAFSNLILDSSGTYTLSVSDGELTGATTNNISISPAAASQLVLLQSPTTGTAGEALGTVKVAVEDAFRNVITSDTSTVTIAVTSGPGALTAGSTTTVAALDGVVTFSNLVLDTAGTYALSAGDGGLSSATTGNVAVSPAAARQLVLQQSPTTGTAGQPLGPSVQVVVEDAFRNVVTSDTSTVTIAVANGPGGLTAGSTTSSSVVAGFAAFSNLVLDTAGTYTLQATDGSLTSAGWGNITISPAAASQLVVLQPPTTATAGQTLGAVMLDVKDAFGNVVTDDTSTVRLAVAGGPGGLTAGSTTSSPVVAGVATFSNLVLDTAGTYTLQATDGSLTPAGWGNITVSPAAASQLILKQSPSAGTAGQTLGTVTLAVEDAFGNVVTSSTSTVDIAVASGPGGLTAGSTTSVFAVDGAVTFRNLVLDAAGTYTLSVSDGGLTGATTGNIRVSAAAASHLFLLQPPTTGTAGQALGAVTLAVEDAFGNVVTSDTSTVTVAVVSGPAGLTAGSTTGVAAVSGVATFGNLILDTAGTYTVKATDGSLTSATSGNITVSSGAADQLVLLQSPTTGTAGQTLGMVRMAAEDAFGNMVMSDTSTVTIAVASGPGGFTAGSTSNVSVVNGVATFSNLVLSQAGAYSLCARDGSFPSALFIDITANLPGTDQLVFLQSPTTGTAGQVLAPFVRVAVENQAGNVMTGDSSAITLALNSGVFAGGGNTLTAWAVDGVATFNNLVFDQAGSYTLRASDGALIGPTSHRFTVNPSAASKLIFLQTPATATAGQALSPYVRVAVEDQFGNLVTGNKSTVTLQVHSGPAGFATGSQIAVAAVNGLATFSKLSLQKVGSYTLGAGDGSLTGAFSNSITVTPGAASKLVFLQTPTTGRAGQVLSPVEVAVEDQFGNVVTSDSSFVTIAVYTGPTGFSSTSLVKAPVVDGIATFNNLALNAVGAYTLAVWDFVLPSAISRSITIQ